jgi:hypothetical protein
VHGWLGDGNLKILDNEYQLGHLDGSRVEIATHHELTDLRGSLAAPLAAMAERVGRNGQGIEAARQHWDRLHRTTE